MVHLLCLLSASAAVLSLATALDASPCAQVSSSVAAQASIPSPTVSAALAYECINSIPLNRTAALSLVESIKPYIRWQSNINWLRSPPTEYIEKVQDPVDIWGGLDAIEMNIRSKWTKEYEFGLALYTLVQSAHDGHFTYVPDVVSKIFNFGRPVPLVSVSMDGKALPEPYVYDDILASTIERNITFLPSKITRINGEDAKTYLTNLSQSGPLQDRDALYNNVFYELAAVSLGEDGDGMGTFTGGGHGRWVYPGPTTEFVFANGSVMEYPNFAYVLVSFANVTSGSDIYTQYFASPANTTIGINSPDFLNFGDETAAADPVATAVSAASSAAGYPIPVVRAPNNAIGGYYLGEDYEDVAILSIPSFGGAGTNNASRDFQSIGRDFVQKARTDGKTKLIVDLSANSGGTILLGYDTFKYLFPTAEAFAAADRFKIFEATDLIGQKFSDISAQYPRTMDDALTNIEGNVASTPFNFATDLKPDGTRFTSWNDKNGPVESKGETYSSLIRWNLSDVLIPYIATFDTISNEPIPTMSQPFEDVVVVTDGYCSSTCSIFAALMRDIAGVNFISLGGRAKSGLSQAVGGVKGTEILAWRQIELYAALVYNYSTAEERQRYDQTSLLDYNDDLPFLRAGPIPPSINLRDAIRKGDESGTPLQFIYEESDCRILYTAEMTVDVTAIWEAVYDSAWGDKSHCIAGKLVAVQGDQEKMKTRPERAISSGRELEVNDYPLDLYTSSDVNGFLTDY